MFKPGDMALAIYSYATDIEGDLHLEVGDVIGIEQIIDEEWVLGRKGDSVGLCPAVFLELQSDGLELENSELNINENVFSSEKLNDQRAENSSVNAQSTSPVLNTVSTGHLESSAELKSNHIPSRTVVPTKSTPEIQLIPASPLSINPPNHTSQPTTKTTSSTNAKLPQPKPTTLELGSKPPLAPKPRISPKPDFLKKPVKPVSSPVKPVLPPKPVTPTEKNPAFSKPNGNCFVLLRVTSRDAGSSGCKCVYTQPKTPQT